MKKATTILFFLWFVHYGSAQEITGKWYMVNRSGLIEVTITKDSVQNRRLFLDMTPKSRHYKSEPYLRSVVLKDRVLLIAKSKTDSTQFSAMTFINMTDQYIQLGWNGLDTSMNSVQELIEVNQNDKRKLYGYYAFSEKYMDTLRKMKPIESMTLEDFKKYIRVYKAKLNLMREEERRYGKGYGSAASYNFQIISQSLYETGFNPLQTIETVDAVYKKYAKDPEIEKILAE